jgi:hypothetical protein
MKGYLSAGQVSRQIEQGFFDTPRPLPPAKVLNTSPKR